MFKSKNGKDFDASVFACWAAAGSPRLSGGEIRIEMELCPPDRRRRDIDNVAKAVLDALVRVGAIPDDSLVQELIIRRSASGEPGVLVKAASAAERRKP